MNVTMVAPPGSAPFFLLLLLLRCPDVQSYEAPADKQDVFAKTACPAFLTFRNVAFLSGVTVELSCHCKPEMVTLHTNTQANTHTPTHTYTHRCQKIYQCVWN